MAQRNDRLARLWPFLRPDDPVTPARGKKRHIEVALALGEECLAAGDFARAERYLLVAEHRAGLITDAEYERWHRASNSIEVA